MTLSEPTLSKPTTATIVPTLEPTIFRCTPGGAIAAGRRRVRRLLLGAVLLMLAIGVAMLVGGRWGPALLCAGAAFLCLLAWRMSGDLDPLWLTLEPEQLTVQMRRQRATLELTDVAARRLTADEHAHLASLTSSAGVTLASASYESRVLGAFDLHATDLEHAVLVEADAPPEPQDRLGSHGAEQSADRVRWIVTPDDPERFLEALEGRVLPPT
jgi:hypothetical protein